ncbi:hypothetical protein F511_26903 [Dorcoceras hygrometricum]|uniref:Uncharacterized protein n=1 Tax=Dorcoceras hygrometricum TaxID=472368 RepID=A0A2Z7B8U7_9LAMI|nr:hypothetical protein F511_26903 [Dorcoceras hygrometricum]
MISADPASSAGPEVSTVVAPEVMALRKPLKWSLRWLLRSRHPTHSHAAAAAAAAARCHRKFVSGQLDEENPFVLISSALLVQPDEGVLDLVVDRIGVNYRNLPRGAGFLSKIKTLKLAARPPPRAAAPPTLPVARTCARWLRAGRLPPSQRAAESCCNGLRRRATRWPCRKRPIVRLPCFERPIVRRRRAQIFACRWRWLRHIMAHDEARAPRRWPLFVACHGRWPPGRGASCCAMNDARARDVATNAMRKIYVVAAPPSPAATPVPLRRCRDGWSDFF